MSSPCRPSIFGLCMVGVKPQLFKLYGTRGFTGQQQLARLALEEQATAAENGALARPSNPVEEETVCDAPVEDFVVIPEEIPEIGEIVDIEEVDEITDEDTAAASSALEQGMVCNMAEDVLERTDSDTQRDTVTDRQDEWRSPDGFSIVDMHHIIKQMIMISEHSENAECLLSCLCIKRTKRSGLKTTVLSFVHAF